MPIEIKEVVIKTNVEKEPRTTSRGDEYVLPFEEMKTEVLKACEQMIKKVLKEKAGR